MFRKFGPWLLLLWMVAGCGSSQNFVATADNPEGGSRGPYFAQIYLDKMDKTSDLEIVANGQTLETLPGGDGIFRLPPGLPSRFTLVGHLQDGTALRREVNLTDSSEGRFFVINVVSHLTALLQDRNPGLSFAQATAKVRTGLGIPPTVPTTDKLSNLPGSPFSHKVFLSQAGFPTTKLRSEQPVSPQAVLAQTPTRTGVEAYAQQVAEDIANGQVRTFTEPLLQLDVDAGEAILGGLLGNVCATPFTLVETQAIGWAAGKMGFENSTEQQLDSIASQLTELSEQITMLAAQLALQGVSQQYAQDQQALSLIYAPAVAQQNSLSSIATATAPSYSTVTNLGPQVPSVAQNLLAGFNSLNTPDSIEQVCGYLLGRNSPYSTTTGNDNIVSTYNSFANASYLGDTVSASEVFNYTSRTDLSTQTYFLPNLQYYLQLLVVLANLDVETAHAGTLPQTSSGYAPPATGFNRAQRDLYTIGQAYQLAQQQVPQMLNVEGVYIDIDNRLIWSGFGLHFQSYQDAVQTAARFQNGPFQGGWSIPTTAQMTSLYNKAFAIADGNQQNVGLAYGRLLGGNAELAPFFYVSDSGDAWDPLAGQLVSSRNFTNGTGGNAIYIRSIPDGTYGDSPFITVFNYGLTIGQNLTLSQSGNQMTALLPSYTPPAGNNQFPPQQDITDLVAWTSSDTTVVDVSNVSSPEGATNTLAPGQLIFHGPGTATITATVIQGSGTLTGSVQVTSTETPTLGAILVSPQNIQYDLLPQPVGTGGFGQQFYLTGFSSDLTAVDLTKSPNTTFALYQLPNPTSAIDPTTVNTSGLTQVPSSVASFGSSAPGFLQINATGGVSPFSSPNLLVVATYTDPTSGTVFQQSSQLVMPTSVAPPPPPPSGNVPTITFLTVTDGPIAGGTKTKAIGTNFTGTTSVTVAGRSATFTVNTDTELSITTPSVSGAGNVPLVVTTPAGSATATYTYDSN